jgi:hypothetical protein
MAEDTLRKGYPDYQRVQNVDQPEPLFFSVLGKEGVQATARMDMGRYQTLCGEVLCNERFCRVRILWYATRTEGSPIGERTFFLGGPAGGTSANIRLVNMGPWCEVRVENTVAGAFSFFGTFFGSTRIYPIEFVTTTGVLVEGQNIFGGAGSIERFPPTIFAGPARAMVFAEGASVAFMDIQYLNASNEYRTIDRLVAPAGALVVSTLVCPATTWKAFISSEGAQTVKFALTPFTTGSD